MSYSCNIICLLLICRRRKEVQTYLDYSYGFSITQNICSLSTRKSTMNIYFLNGFIFIWYCIFFYGRCMQDNYYSLTSFKNVGGEGAHQMCIKCLGRQYHFKFFKGCLPQILLGPFLTTLTQILILTQHGHESKEQQ